MEEDLLGIKLHLELDGKKEVISDLQTLIKELQSMGIKLDLGLENGSIEKEAQRVKSKITEVFKSTKINPEINQQAFTDLHKRLVQVRSEVDQLAKIDIKTDGKNNIQSAILSYKDGMGKVVTETMAWHEVLDKVSGTLTKTFSTQSFKYSDDISKQTQGLEKLTLQYKQAQDAQDKMINSAMQLRQVSKTDMDVASVDTFIQKLSSIDIYSDNAKSEIDALSKEFNNLSLSIKNTNSQIDLIDKIKSKLIALDNIANKNTNFNPTNYNNIKKSYEDLEQEISSGNIVIGQAKVKYDALNAELMEFNNVSKQSSKTQGSLVKSINNFTHFNIISESVQLLRRGFRDAVDIVYELDSSLLELSKVSDLTKKQLDNVTKEAFDLGQSFAKTGTEVINAVTTFKRAGFDLKESFTLGKDALVLTSVAEGIKDVETASSSMIAVLRGYGMEVQNATHIVDAFNEVSNTQAVNFDDLVEGATRISGVMNQKGNSFEEMLGLLTGGTEVLRNIEKVSSGLNVIAMRLAGMDELGDKLDPQIVSSMTDQFERLAGISLVDSTGQLRDTYDILADMAKVLPTLDRNTQSLLIEEASGLLKARPI